MMKGLWKYVLCFFMIFAIGLTAEAADKEMNRRLGYFDNTRTVLLLPVRYQDSSGGYAAAYLKREMEQVFRYPYYRQLNTTDYALKNISPSQLPELAEETNADLVVMPVVTQWVQWRSVPVSLFFDRDPIVETRVIVDVYSYKKGEDVRDDRASYFEREEEGSVRDSYIMDEVTKRLWKKFPYRRVPTDVSKALSGETDQGENHTPAAQMNK